MKAIRANNTAAIRIVRMVALFVLLVPAARAQTGGLGLIPGRLEVEMQPGREKTVAFEIEAPPSNPPVAGRLLLSLTDWNIKEDGSVHYPDPGTLPFSASSWVIFSPAAVTITSGQRQLVRVTIKVPENTPPGDYRTALFVQERPLAARPQPGERRIYLRFRYVFTLYVLIAPVSGQGEFRDIAVETDGGGSRVVFRMENKGSRHLRPRIGWSMRDSRQAEIATGKNQEATVLLPAANLKELIPIETLPPGRYEIIGQVDFQDGKPIQSLKRPIEVSAPKAGVADKPKSSGGF